MPVKTKYVTSDGSQFDYLPDAQAHEERHKFVEWVKEINRNYQEIQKMPMAPGVLANMIWDNWKVEEINGENSG